MSKRNQNVEALRVVAALSIIAFHEHAPGWRTWYAGLSVFLALSGCFAVTSPKPWSLQTQARRLLLPWAVAWVAYGLLDLAEGKPPLPLGPLVGTSIHLWYLPFVFVAEAAICALRRHPRTLGFMAFSFGLVATLALPSDPFPGAAAAIYLHAVPAICAGALFGLLQGRSLRSAAPLLCALGVLASFGGVDFVLGAGLTLAALALPSMHFRVTPLSRYMLPVYLLHAAFLSLAHLGGLHGWPAVALSFSLSLTLAFVGSVVADGWPTAGTSRAGSIAS